MSDSTSILDLPTDPAGGNNNTNVNYKEQLELYYKYPQLLLIDKYQLDIYIYRLLKFDKIIEEKMWIVLYKQTNVFFESFTPLDI